MLNVRSTLANLRVKNNSGEEIPPYACMQLDYAFDSGKSACFRNGAELVFQVVKPDEDGAGDASLIVFNGPLAIAEDDFGSAIVAPILHATMDLTADDPSPGDECGAESGSWDLTTAGSGFIFKSVDSGLAYVDGDVKTIFIERAGGGSELAYFYPPASGIPAATFNSITKRLTPGKASCKRAIRYSATEYTEGTGSEVVENIVSSIVATSEWPFAAAKNEYGTWTIVVENCASSSGGGQIGDQQTDPTPDPSPEI